ncbi:MAG: hypothetical protein KF775_08875 [Cyclobacteriaceae bacterium]|nr:hypothetical protein [Cyclobacteriaceae bacterium]
MNRNLLYWSFAFASFLTSTSVRGNDFLKTLEEAFQNYKAKFPRNSILLTFNQPSYIPGDTAFFSVYYLSEGKKTIKGTHLVHVDIVSGNGEVVKKSLFKLRDGIGHSKISIDNSIQPGIYKFIGYTDAMIKGNQHSFFQEEIEIVGNSQFRKKLIKNELTFYPEGGSLIATVENKIFINGPPNTEVFIKSESGISVATVKLDLSGHGTFFLKPSLSDVYKAYTYSPDAVVSLPKPLLNGLSIVFDEKTWKAKISISDLLSEQRKTYYAILTANGSIIWRDELAFGLTNQLTIKFPEPENSGQSYKLYIIDNNGQEVAHRVFTHLNRPDSLIIIDDLSITQSTKSDVRLQLSNQGKDFSGGVATITCILNDLFPRGMASPFTYLYDIPRAYNWIKEAKGNETYINDFLISERPETINWNLRTEAQLMEPTESINEVQKIRGLVVRKSTNTPLLEPVDILIFLQKNLSGYETETKAGYFEVPVLFDFWGDDELFVTARSKGLCVDDQVDILILTDSVKLEDRWHSVETGMPHPYKHWAEIRNSINESYSFYSKKAGSVNELVGLNAKLQDEFQGADYHINLKDYLVFSSMEDIIKEIVTYAQVKIIKGKKAIRLYYRHDKSVVSFSQDPLYIVDGVMTTNTSDFLNIKPDDVVSIEIMNNPNKLSQIGALGANGIVLLESKSGRALDNKRNMFPITGLTSFPKDKHTQFDIPVGSRPDLRSNLIWIPNFIYKATNPFNISLQAGDDVGLATIVISGIKANGVFFFNEKQVEIGVNSKR